MKDNKTLKQIQELIKEELYSRIRNKFPLEEEDEERKVELPKEYKIRIIKQGNGAKVELIKKRRVEGFITVRRSPDIKCLKAWVVKGSAAPHGIGPILYDIAMELAGKNGICADITAVSDEAQGVWNYYLNNRPDVEHSHPLSLIPDDYGNEESGQ
jgi:hypothetical protein